MLLSCGTMLVLASRDNAHLADESLRIALGYTHLAYGNLKLNLEDPPLGKELAAVPLLFMHLRLPRDLSSLAPGKFGKGEAFNFSSDFLYGQSVPVDTLLFYPRMVVIVLALFLAYLVFAWTRRLWGDRAGLLALFLYCTSPTILAHAPFVTLDVVSALGAFASTWSFVRLLTDPSSKNTRRTGFVLALSSLVKFNLVALYPFFMLLTAMWIFVDPRHDAMRLIRRVAHVFLLSIVLIVLYYQVHFFFWPVEDQAKEIGALVAETTHASYAPTMTWLCSIPVVRVLVQIFMGIALRLYHSESFSYLHGEGYFGGIFWFWPTAFIIKETPCLQVMLLACAAVLVVKTVRRKRTGINGSLRENFPLVTSLCWIVGYTFIAVSSSNDDGLRHLAPVFPFVHMVVGGVLGRWWSATGRRTVGSLLLLPLLALQLYSVAATYPHFLGYFNEWWIRPGTGYRYLALSNLDLHQEAKRLGQWADENRIERLKVASDFYFSVPDRPGRVRGFWYSRAYQYYLGARYEYLPPDRPATGWIAIPATLLAYGTAIPRDQDGWGSDSFRWLLYHRPAAVIGNATFIYYIPDVQ